MYAKKSLGQNFLKSKEALRAIIEAGNLSDEDIVLEVGPGKGALTESLLEKAGRVIAIEKDTRLVPILQERFKREIELGKLEIREEDILDLDVTVLPENYKLIANIPYYITGILIRKFLSGSHQPNRMVLLLQKEVAKRIVAQDKKESLLSISVKVYGTPRYVETVKAKYFSPQPKVDSGIISIENISKNFFKDFSEEKFFEIVKTGFAHKRKKFSGNLKARFEAELIQKVFQENAIPENARAEDISLEDWKKVVEKISIT